MHEESLDVLRGLKIAIDANILLDHLGQDSNAHKFVQEGGCSLDLGLQRSLVKFIRQLRQKYQIELLIVIDGLLPKLINEKQDHILQKSIELWNTVGGSNQQLF